MTALRAQRDVHNCPEGKAIHKWKTFRHVCEAKALLGLSDRALAILSALLSFHPDTVLTIGARDLVVFPSNQALSLRAHGIPASTLRRHIAVLVASGLILRRDSPNGKRYARRSADGGDIEQAFGFDLSPLVARADQLADLAASVVCERRAVDLLREQITIARRDIAKMIAAGVGQGIEADWAGLHRQFRDLLDRRPGVSRRDLLEPLATALRDLSTRILAILERHIEATAGGMAPASARSQAHSRAVGDTLHDDEPSKADADGRPARNGLAAVPVRLLAETCPDFVDYARDGLRTTRDVSDTAAIVRPLLGVSPSAWDEACSAMGQGQASVTLALILQRGRAIKNPGGYLRTLARRASAGQFSVWPMLLALNATRRRQDLAQSRTPARPSFPDEMA